MKLSVWLWLATFIMLIFLFGMFSRSRDEPPTFYQVCNEKTESSLSPSPLLCGQKIKLSLASAYDFAAIDGISHKLARQLVDYCAKNPQASIDDLLAIKGVGPKILARLKRHFE